MITEAQVDAALPPSGFIRDYVTYGKSVCDCNTAYHLAAGLTVLAQTAPIDYGIPFGPSIIPANLFVLLVGPSTQSRKSAAIKIARELLQEACPGSVGEEPGSEEGMIESIRSNRRQVMMFSEFGRFLAKAEAGYLMAIKTRLNDIYDGAVIGHALAKKQGRAQEKDIGDHRVCVLAGCAPDYLERHTEPVDWSGGFLARFFTINAVRERQFTFPKDDKVIRQALVNNLKQRNEIQVMGKCLGLDPAALAMWEAYFLKQDNYVGAVETAAAAARAPGIALRIAQLLALDYGPARSGQDWWMTTAELAPAIRMAGLHLQSVMEIGATLAPSKDMRERRIVLSYIRDDPTSYGEILLGAKLLVRRVKELMESLQEEGTVVKCGHDDRGSLFMLATSPMAPTPAPMRRVQTLSSFGARFGASAEAVAAPMLVLAPEPAPSIPDPEPTTFAIPLEWVELTTPSLPPEPFAVPAPASAPAPELVWAIDTAPSLDWSGSVNEDASLLKF
ncbi:MAG: hypothetical protein Q7R39_16805 [Dehalococcoidia bacterium]|nr:hypothetical protein [Dehalococcoidia bacterium]